MKNKFMYTSYLICGVLLLGGCGMMNDTKKAVDQGMQDVKNEKPVEDTKNAVEDTKKAVTDSMDNMMSYFKEKGVELTNVQPIESMDFAAHEGKSFAYNGTTGYLYRLKSSDQNMKALLDEAKNKGVVKVNIDGEEQEYKASVNGDYLLVYAKDGTLDDVVSLVQSYQPGNFTNPNDPALSSGNTNGNTNTNQNANDTTNKN